MNYEEMKPIRRDKDPFTRFPNSYLDHMAELNPYEFKILALLVRKTYGWGKESDKISISQFANEAGISSQMVQKSLKALEEKGLVTKEKSYKKSQSGGVYCDSTIWGIIFTSDVGNDEVGGVGNDTSEGRQQESRRVGNDEVDGVGNDTSTQKKGIKEKKENIKESENHLLSQKEIEEIITLYPETDPNKDNRPLRPDTNGVRKKLKTLIKRYGAERVKSAVVGCVWERNKSGVWFQNFEKFLESLTEREIERLSNVQNQNARERTAEEIQRDYDFSEFEK